MEPVRQHHDAFQVAGLTVHTTNREENESDAHGGIEAQMAKLETKGHTIVQRGKRYFVEDFATRLSGTR